MDSVKEEFSVPERISDLRDLAYNLWWSWHPEARMLFKTLSHMAWKLSVHNPVRMFREMDKAVLEEAAKDPVFLQRYDAVMDKFRHDAKSGGGWFVENIADPQMSPIAFFSAEYGLHHSLPFYAGGLGFLAGDFLKECSDLGIPVVAIGFMYPEALLSKLADDPESTP